VIGYDGGLANLYSDDENENTLDTDSVVEELSFTNVLIITDVRFFGTGEFPFTAVAECSPLER
jgi:hypothetical protein